MAKPIVISVLADAAGVGKGTREAEGFLGRLGDKALKVGKIVGVAAAGAVMALGVASVNAASEAEQSIGATQQIYGKYASAVIADSKKAAQAVGVSANEYRELSNGLGAMLKNAGTPMDKLGDKTGRLVTLGADLAATFGGTTKDAVAAVSSLMRGEADPIERYGISIKQSDVNARLAADGLSKLTGAKLKEAEANARLSLLYEQSADAQGQFARESNTLAGQQQRLGAQFDDMKVALGTRLLPVVTSVFAYLNENGPAAFSAVESAITAMRPALDTAINAAQSFAGVIGDTVGVLADNKATLAVLAGGYVAYKAITLGVAAAEWAVYLWRSRQVIMGAAHIAITKGMTIAQTGLNTAMRANPIGLIITGLTLLAAGLTYAWQNSETFRTIVLTAFAGVQQAGQWLWDKIKAVGGGIATAVGLAGRLVRGYVGLYVGAFNLLVSGASAVLSGVRSAFSTVTSFLSGIPGKVKGYFSSAGTWLRDAGRKIIDGLVAGIKAAAGKVKDALGGITSKLTSWKGPESLDKVILTPAGEYIIDGFIKGVENREDKLKRSLGGITQLVADTAIPALALPELATPRVTAADYAAARAFAPGTLSDRSSGNHYTIKVEVSPMTQPHEVGRAIVEAIEAYERLGGRR